MEAPTRKGKAMFLIVPLLAVGMATFTPSTSAETVVDTCDYACSGTANMCPDPDWQCIRLVVSDDANNSIQIYDTKDPILLAQAEGRIKQYRWGTIHVACPTFEVESLVGSVSNDPCAMAGGDFVQDGPAIFNENVELPTGIEEKCRVGLYDAYLTVIVQGTGIKDQLIGQVAKPEDLSPCLTRKISVDDTDANT